MSLLSRYLTSTYLSLFAIVLPGLTSLYLVIFAFEKMDEFLEAKVPAGIVLSYFFFFTPGVCFEMAPLSMMLAGVLTLMILSRHNELLAIRTIGIRPSRVIMPFFAVTLFVAFALLALQVFYIPRATEISENIWAKEVDRKKPKGVFLGDRLFYHGKGAIWTMKLASPDGKMLKDVERISFDKDYRINEFTAAKTAGFSDKEWTFRNGILQTYENELPMKLNAFEIITREVPERPEDFIAIETPVKFLGMMSLWKSMNRLKKAGYKTEKLEIHFWGNVFYPFLGVSLLLFACPMILTRQRGGLALGMSLGLILGILGWLFWNAMLFLGKSGDFPPFLAVVLVHVCLLGGAAVFYKKMRF